MEGEEGIAVIAADNSTRVAVDHPEWRASFGLPFEVLDIGLQPQEQRYGIDDQWKLSKDEVILAHTKAVHVGRF